MTVTQTLWLLAKLTGIVMLTTKLSDCVGLVEVCTSGSVAVPKRFSVTGNLQ